MFLNLGKAGVQAINPVLGTGGSAGNRDSGAGWGAGREAEDWCCRRRGRQAGSTGELYRSRLDGQRGRKSGQALAEYRQQLQRGAMVLLGGGCLLAGLRVDPNGLDALQGTDKHQLALRHRQHERGGPKAQQWPHADQQDQQQGIQQLLGLAFHQSGYQVTGYVG